MPETWMVVSVSFVPSCQSTREASVCVCAGMMALTPEQTDKPSFLAPFPYPEEVQ